MTRPVFYHWAALGMAQSSRAINHPIQQNPRRQHGRAQRENEVIFARILATAMPESTSTPFAHGNVRGWTEKTAY
ncbi:hypothetical protein N7532_002062 [Penicillium argentinense]|uniref:Uncharacterized protein n=1 Tax=Penicillium argentinense TaxID=1131581 RepID=A0A9W9KN29_9EURO|nr:uncharacterized protein N7532_002062 [Penicillium argentinense]KAJ5111527.1 hypothetical protein N7532_002062 [Penicillium argentinense]